MKSVTNFQAILLSVLATNFLLLNISNLLQILNYAVDPTRYQVLTKQPFSTLPINLAKGIILFG